MAEMQMTIDAENSDLFDVLAYVAYALPPLTRQLRARQASSDIQRRFKDKQRIFVEFVLAQYVSQGVDELGMDKLAPLLRLQYHNAIADAVKDLGTPEEIRVVFSSFQKYLYRDRVAA